MCQHAFTFRVLIETKGTNVLSYTKFVIILKILASLTVTVKRMDHKEVAVDVWPLVLGPPISNIVTCTKYCFCTYFNIHLRYTSEVNMG